MKKKFTLIIIIMAIIYSGNTYAIDLEKFKDIDIHGFISQGYMKSDHNNFLADTETGTFEFNELGINFSTDLSDKLHMGLQFFSRDLGKEGNNEITLDWAFADYRWQDWLGIRVGKMKLIGGLYNETREIDMLRTSALLPQSVYAELYRDTFSSVSGAGIYGDIPMSLAGSLFYNCQIGVLPLDTDGGFAKAYKKNMYKSTSSYWSVNTFEHNYYYTFAGTWSTPLDGLKSGGVYYSFADLYIDGSITGTDNPLLSAYVGAPYYYDVETLEGYYLSAEYTWNDLVLAGEFSHMDIEGKVYVSKVLFSKSEAPNEGWYVSGSYRFTRRLELGLCYSEYYPRSNDKEGSEQPQDLDFLNWLKDYTFSARFDINDNWTVKLEYHNMDGFGAFSTAENIDAELEKDWNLFVAKVTFSF